MPENLTSNELDYPPKFSEYEAEWSKRGYEPHIATLLAKADWSEDMINWQEDEIDRLHNEIEAGGSRERGTSPNRSCGTAGQSGPASSLRSTNEPGPTLNDAIRCIDYADCMLAQSGYTEDSTIRMRLANARAIISGASQSPNDGWSALCEAVAKADPVNYRRPTQPPPESLVHSEIEVVCEGHLHKPGRTVITLAFPAEFPSARIGDRWILRRAPSTKSEGAS